MYTAMKKKNNEQMCIVITILAYNSIYDGV